MILSLPHPLLALLICLLETARALEDSPSSPTTAQSGNVGDYVAYGLDIYDGSRATTTTQIAAAPAVTTGTGQAYASSCASALSTWSSNSFKWQWIHAIVTTSTFSSSFTETMQQPGATKVTSIITLCDGYPRVVGYSSVSTAGISTSTVAWTNTITQTLPNRAYPTPSPCYIQPSDCKTLSRSYESWLTKQLKASDFATMPAPMCTVTPPRSYSYSTNLGGKTCNNCMIAASTARVMFWPVTTAAAGNLCSDRGSTITTSPTGPPNSFVTEGITITSPSVAVSIGYISRVDGCGTTVDHTIIPVHPDQVSSVRGFRALFSHHRFNFADLNYFCEDTNTTNATIAEGKGDSCYQQVPADVYFGGLNNAVVYDQAPFRNLSKADMTIWDDYQPQLLPPRTMTEAIASLWGKGCIIHPNGVWDPPVALTPEASLIVPTYPGGPASTDPSDPEGTPASPINSYGAVPPSQTGIKRPTPPADGTTSEQQHFTALPQETGGYGGGGGGGSGSGDGEATTGQHDGSDSDGADGNTSGGSDGGNGQGGQSSHDNSESGSNGESQDNSGSGNGAGGSGSGQSNPGGVTRIEVHTTIITVGNKILQCTKDSNGAWTIPDITTTHTASVGGTAVEVDRATLTAGANGLVNVDMQNSVLTIGNKVLTASQDHNGAWVIPDASTTHTVSQGDSAVAVDGVTVTAGSEGLIKAHASGSGDSSDGSSEESGTGTQNSGAARTNTAQSTSSATSSDGAAAAMNTDSGGAGATRWSPAFLALALLSTYLWAL